MSMPVADLARRIQERYRGWCAPTGELIARSQLWVRTPIHDVPTLPSWHRERVVLIGDAAHAMSPAGGQGASLALEDAMLLGQLVAERARPLDQSFARFEQLRRSRAEAMVAQGYENDQRTLKELGAFGMWMRDTLLMPLFAPMIGKALTKVYAGDPALVGEGGMNVRAAPSAIYLGAAPVMTNPYDEIGGREKVIALVERFYDVMEQAEPALAALHELDAQGKVSRRNRDRFGSFLVGWLGGPDDYVRDHGHPRLRMRHSQVPINSDHARRLGPLHDGGDGRLRGAACDTRVPAPALRRGRRLLAQPRPRQLAKFTPSLATAPRPAARGRTRCGRGRHADRAARRALPRSSRPATARPAASVRAERRGPR